MTSGSQEPSPVLPQERDSGFTSSTVPATLWNIAFADTQNQLCIYTNGLIPRVVFS